MKTLKILLALCLFTVTATPAHAQSIETLTQENVSAFVMEMTEISKPKESGAISDDAFAYLEKHVHKNAAFKSEITYSIPGMPEQTASVSLNKKEFMENLKNGQEAMRDYKSSIKIESVDISSLGTNATVTTSGTESGQMLMESEGKREYVPTEGVSVCTQIVMLNEGTPELYNANCKTHISFSGEF